jgi:hypothetical protein
MFVISVVPRLIGTAAAAPRRERRGEETSLSVSS